MVMEFRNEEYAHGAKLKIANMDELETFIMDGYDKELFDCVEIYPIVKELHNGKREIEWWIKCKNRTQI